jgi:hypothetical protein
MDSNTKLDYVLDAAKQTIADRGKSYGTPFDNHSCTATLWTVYLNACFKHIDKVTPRMVCMMNMLQKISRDTHTSKTDSLIDICGYAQNAHDCTIQEIYDPD